MVNEDILDSAIRNIRAGRIEDAIDDVTLLVEGEMGVWAVSALKYLRAGIGERALALLCHYYDDDFGLEDKADV